MMAEKTTVRPARRHCSGDGGVRVESFCHLLAEAAHDEEGVVDGEAEADEGDARLGESVHLCRHADEGENAGGADDGEAADQQGEECGEDTAEDDDEEHADDGQTHQFGAFNVFGHAGVEGAGDGGLPGDVL